MEYEPLTAKSRIHLGDLQIFIYKRFSKMRFCDQKRVLATKGEKNHTNTVVTGNTPEISLQLCIFKL